MVTDRGSEAGKHTLAEIRSEPEVWRECLGELESSGELARLGAELPKNVEWVFVGCGSSFYLAQIAAAAWPVLTSARARAIPASEILIFPETFPRDSQAVVISRSGRTSEVIDAARYFEKTLGLRTLGITCGTATPLERETSHTIRLAAADEKSTVMTRSFTSMLLALEALAAERGAKKEFRDSLREMPGQVSVPRLESTAKTVASSQLFADYVFLGQGPFFGVAQESMLKVKEMSCSYAQAFHTLEFRHGPKAIVSPETLVTFFLSDSGFAAEAAVLEEIKDLGGTTLVIANHANALVEKCSDFLVELSLNAPEAARAAAAVIPGQLLGFYTGVGKGFNPDQPRNLTRVVMLDALDGEGPKRDGS